MALDGREYTENTGTGADMHGVPAEPLMRILRTIIHIAVRGLAVLMTLVIVLGVVDVGLQLWQTMMAEPYMIVRMNDIMALFGAFMAVLIGIEIFVNITIYLRDDVIHVKIVMATALMAVARKVIIMDVEQMTWELAISVAAVVLAMSVGYYLVVVRDNHQNVKTATMMDGSVSSHQNQTSISTDR